MLGHYQQSQGGEMTTTESVRKSEAKRIALGQRQIRVWVPDDPAVISAIRKIAADACRAS
jgi:hypothetical protein